MKQKKFRFSIALLASAMIFAGCSSQSTVSETDSQDETEETVTEETVTEETETVGGWTVFENYTVILTDEENDIFNRAVEGLTGVSYDPITVVADQVVAGTNYAYLCYGETATSITDSAYYIVTVYNDLEGNAEILAINKITAGEVLTAEQEDTSEMTGAWEIRGSGKPGGTSEDAETALSAAIEKDNLTVMPIVLLATQIVSGTNYEFLVYENNGLYVVTVYADLEGNAEVTANEPFDLLTYVSSEN